MKRSYALLLAAVFFLAAPVLAQVFLGNVIRLGQSTTANLPTPSSTNLGGLIFDLDAGAPKYSNGTSWLLMGGGGDSFWIDAGVVDGIGSMLTLTPVALPDAGFIRIERLSVGDINGSGTVRISGVSLNVDENSWLGFDDGMPSGATTSPSFGIQKPFGATSLSIRGGSFGAQLYDSSGTYGSNVRLETTRFSAAAGSGTNGYSQSTGARVDLGAGTSDYAVSDGTGIETPVYWESTRAVTAGPGLIAVSAQVSGAAFSSFTSTNRTALGSGNLLRNTTTNDVWQSTSSGFRPLEQNVAISRQRLTTNVLGTGKSTFPEVNERIRCDSFGGTGDTVQMYWDHISTTTNTATSGRTYSGLISADAATRAKGYTACSSASTTLYTPVYAGAPNAASYTSFCSYIVGGTTTDSIVWVLLANAETGADATTLAAAGFGFRYDAATGSNWYACYYDGTNHCSDTSVAYGTNTEYVMCAYQVGTASLTWTINGVVTNTAAAVTTLSNAAPVIILDATAGTNKTLGVGAFQIDSL